MSEQDARTLIERMETDEAFRVRVSSAEGPAEFFKLLETEGLDCSAEEIAVQVSQLELNEADLDLVTGGDSGSQEGVSDPWGILRYTQGYS